MHKPSQKELRRAVEEALSQAASQPASRCEGRIKEDGPAQENRPGKKPEHMTHLRGDHLVYKDHPRIAFRGAIDSLESEIILVQILAQKKGMDKLTQDLQEIIKAIRWLLRCEVSGDPVGEITLLGLNTDQLRAHSHHPSQYYGMSHFLPDYQKGEMAAHFNRLRTRAREVELIAYRAFKREDGEVCREDILRILNRLSSLFWIMMFQYLTGKYENEEGRRGQ